MNANQTLFWEVFLAFCFSWVAIALITHWVILRRDKRKRRPAKKPVKKKSGKKRRK